MIIKRQYGYLDYGIMENKKAVEKRPRLEIKNAVRTMEPRKE